jgi:uncharacterized membrane protein
MVKKCNTKLSEKGNFTKHQKPNTKDKQQAGVILNNLHKINVDLYIYIFESQMYAYIFIKHLTPDLNFSHYFYAVHSRK